MSPGESLPIDLRQLAEMPSYRRLIANEPLWIFAVLWPVVFLAPLLPGLPKVWLSNLPWRQELVVSLLLLITFGLLLRRSWSKHPWNISISEYGSLLPLTFFICGDASRYHGRRVG